MRSLSLPDLEVARRLESGARARLDPERMRRAVVNVCLNAFQAMAETGAPGRRLEMRVVSKGPGSS